MADEYNQDATISQLAHSSEFWQKRAEKHEARADAAERRLARIHELVATIADRLLGSEAFSVVAEISELSKGETK